MKKIPYGIANFEIIKENSGFYFVDKTEYIKVLENLGGRFLFFLRPRRFGKSLFLSMLEHYYDPRRKEQFEELFGDTYIGKNPTSLKHSLPILKLNFSGLPTYGPFEEIIYSFNLNFSNNIKSFFVKYENLFNISKEIQKEILSEKSAGNLLNIFIARMSDINVKYYLLIDEYDNFANNVLIHYGKDQYQKITHQSGFLRNFFAAIKNGTESRAIERMFVTGVSPLVLSDVTSGMNIGDNISNKMLFNSMVGFTQREVEEILDYYITQNVVKKEEQKEILLILEENYNNYCFSENTKERVYNSDMVLYFFNNYLQEKKIPSNLIDENVRIDYGKLRFLILEEKKLNGNFSILSELINNNEIETNLVHNFALNDIVEKDKFKSFLYYLGLLTIKKQLYGSKYILNIPNEVIKTMHFDYIRQSLNEGYDLNIDIDFLRHEFDKTAFNGKWKTLFKYILEKFYEAASIRDFIFREEGIKMFILAYLNVTPLYFVESEPEMNKGYADIFLRKNYGVTDLTNYEYIIELKYINAKIASNLQKDDKNKLEEIRKDAVFQLEKYAKTRKITCTVKKLLIICSAQKVLLLEEIQSISTYAYI